MTGRMGAVPVRGPLPVSLIDFTGKPGNNRVNLYWNTAAEYNVKTIVVVKRSTDGINFDRFTEVTPKGSSSLGT